MAVTNKRGIFSLLDVRERQGLGVWSVKSDVWTSFFEQAHPFGYFAGGAPAVSTVRRVDYSNDTSTSSPKGALFTPRRRHAGVGNQNFGYFAGGGNTSAPLFSSVDRIDYSNDTSQATVRGPLSAAQAYNAAAGNSDFGYFASNRTIFERINYSNDTVAASQRASISPARYLAATGNASYGYFGGGIVAAAVSTVDRIDYANDTAAALVKGPLNTGRSLLAATGNASFGYFGGGIVGPAFSGEQSIVDRVDYSNDTATASPKGPLSNTPEGLAATGSSSFGYFAAGIVSPSLEYSTVNRVDYSNDTATASIRGPLHTLGYQFAASSAQANGITKSTFFSKGNVLKDIGFDTGYFGGGFGPTSSTVDRINYSNDTATASAKGPLSAGRYHHAATGNASFGYFGGGAPGPLSTVDRIDYSNDTATASPKGPLSSARYRLAATGNQSYGYFGGGNGPVSTVDRIDYSNDTATASPKGPLSLARQYVTATGNSSFGYFGGGNPGPLSTVDRIDYSNDTETASPKGPLSLGRYQLAATGNADFGYFGGGRTPSTVSTVDRIDYSNDIATASPKGPLSVAKYSVAATGNASFGYFSGGDPGSFSTVDRIDYSNDTATAPAKGPLSVARYHHAASSARANGLVTKTIPLPINYATGNVALSNVGYWYRTNTNVDAVTALDFSNDTSNINNRSSLNFPGTPPLGAFGYGAIGNTGFGYFADANSPQTGVRRIDYANDTADAIVTRNLNHSAGAQMVRAGVGNNVYGYFTNTIVSALERIDYANDLVTDRGGCLYPLSQRSGTGNLNFGYIIGGSGTPSPSSSWSSIERIDYSTDGAAALVRGPLSSGEKRYGGACGNADGGYSMGGDVGGIPGTTSSVERIDYSNDTVAAAPKGNLNVDRDNCAASGNADYGYVYGNGYSPSATVTYFDRIDYSNDTATASIRGTVANIPASPGSGTRCHAAIGPRDNALYSLNPNTGQLPSSLGLPIASRPRFPVTAFGYFISGSPSSGKLGRINFLNDTENSVIRGLFPSPSFNSRAATGNSSFGYFGGGTWTSQVDRIEYTNDIALAVTRGPLNQAKSYLGATGTQDFGYFGGGDTPGTGAVSTLDRIDYSNDTAAGLARGPLLVSRNRFDGVGNQSFGYFGGGNPGPKSSVDRIDYSNDTASLTPVGPLTRNMYYYGVTGNSSGAYFTGGTPGTLSSVERMDYSNDTAAPTPKGPLSRGNVEHGATGNENYGYFIGGFPGNTSTIERIDYANDTVVASIRSFVDGMETDECQAVSPTENGLPQSSGTLIL